ncbi:hypothetical protein ACTXT7_009948 [Hymenolepis weldensis]
MLATVDITVKAPDMFSASRHAQRLAGNFLDDVDEFQRASRAADRRAMSHFDDATTTTYFTRPRRSMSVSRVVTVPSEYYIERPRYRSVSVEPRYTYSTTGITQPVTMVGSRYYTPSSKYYHYLPRYYTYDTYYPNYSYYYDHPVYNTSAYKYWPTVIPSNFSHYLPTTSFYTRNNTSFDYTLPTSGLRASLPSWVDPAMIYPQETIHVHEYPRRRFRYGSVPPISPAASAQYRRAGSVARVLPPVRYVTEYYSDLTGQTPINSKYVYHTPMGLPPRPYYTPASRYCRISNGPQNNLERAISQEVLAERRRIDRKMDDLLSYRLPDPMIYDSLKSSLRKVHDKMDVHRSLLDRYSAINMNDGALSVEDRINAKCQEIGDRMAR